MKYKQDADIGNLKPLLNTRQIMTYLHVNRTTLWEISNRDENPLPSLKVGGGNRYQVEEVDAWLESCRPAR